MTTAHDGGKVVSLTRRLLVLISVRGWVSPRAIVRSKGFYVNEKSTDTSWDWTSDLPICATAVPCATNIRSWISYWYVPSVLWVVTQRKLAVGYRTFGKTFRPLLRRVKKRPIYCPETSVLRKNPADRSPGLCVLPSECVCVPCGSLYNSNRRSIFARLRVFTSILLKFRFFSNTKLYRLANRYRRFEGS